MSEKVFPGESALLSEVETIDGLIQIIAGLPELCLKKDRLNAPSILIKKAPLYFNKGGLIQDEILKGVPAPNKTP